MENNQMKTLRRGPSGTTMNKQISRYSTRLWNVEIITRTEIILTTVSTWANVSTLQLFHHDPEINWSFRTLLVPVHAWQLFFKNGEIKVGLPVPYCILKGKGCLTRLAVNQHLTCCRPQRRYCNAYIWISTGFNTKRDPAFYLIAEPDPGRQTNADLNRLFRHTKN